MATQSLHKIELGDEVKHIHTGFKGIATQYTEYISGCRRITITPKVKKDGTLGDSMAFDEPEIEIIKSKKVVRKNDTGGWQPTVRHYLK